MGRPDAYAPVAVNDTGYTVDEDGTLNVAASGVLTNDSDADGDTLTTVLVNGPANGALTLNADGSFTYTPDDDYNGSDSFTYRANDGAANSNTATVSITVNSVNDAAIAVGDGYTIDQDMTLNIAAAGVLSNDSDVDGDPMTAVLGTGPANGSLTLNGDGSFTYTPDAGFFGSDSFTYRANDGSVDSNLATVSITVNRINNLPVAANDAYNVNEDNTLNVAAAGILINDSDADGDSLTAVLVSGPTDGSLTLSADGSFTYSPDDDFNGSDDFTYKADDGIGDSNVATVTITVNSVNDAPVAVNDNYNVAEDGSLNVPASGVLVNDSDVDGDSLAVSLVSGPVNGGLTLNSNGSFTYTPTANFHGSDSFTYEVNDGQGGTAEATASITVTSVNDVPVAANDSAITDEDSAVVIDVLANDSDADGDSLIAAVVSGPANGSLTTNPDGSFTYTPDDDFNGSDSFTYRATDGSANSNTATVSITVHSVNDASVAANDAYSVEQDGVLTVASSGVLGNDSDVDGDPLTAVLTVGSSNGSLTLNANGSFRPVI